MKKEQVLNALSGLTNGALNYYQAPQTVLVRDKLIRDYIENLQSQLKAKEEVIKEIKNHCEIEINASNHYLENHKSQKELCHKVAHQRILEILSKGENK